MNKINYLLFFVSILFLANCTPKYEVVQETKATERRNRTIPETLYYADTNGDGNYGLMNLETPPEPIQGKEQWVRAFYGSIKYPAMARENGIQGIVILELVRSFGFE